MKHPEMVYSNDFNNNCIIIKWGESGYYKTDYPEGQYTDDLIDNLNELCGITRAERDAMVLCSMAAGFNPALDWEKHYQMCLERRQQHDDERKSSITII